MNDEKMIENLFNKLFDNNTEKEILKIVINERDIDTIIKQLIKVK